jgi:cytochrome c
MVWLWVVTSVIVTRWAATAEPSADHGRVVFQVCLACHNNRPDALGPNLSGIVGRPAGGLEGFRYSNAMRRARFTWDSDRLRAFLRDPQALVPGNRMPFSGLADPKDIEDVVAFLASLK